MTVRLPGRRQLRGEKLKIVPRNPSRSPEIPKPAAKPKRKKKQPKKPEPEFVEWSPRDRKDEIIDELTKLS